MKNCLVFICFCCLGFLSEFFVESSLYVARSSSRTSVGRLRAAPRNICPTIFLKNGVAKRRSPRSRLVRFFCNRGYLLAGEKHSTCNKNQWDPPIPRCVRPTCKTIGQKYPDNVLAYPTHSKAVLHFFCGSGFSLNGPSTIYCDGSTWSDHVPTCIPVNTKPKLSCDFETADLCGWRHDLNHDFDWIRENFNTPSGSIGTGPSFDHTKGIGENGYYMYIESSSRAPNDTARLISPVYDKMDDDVCLEFFYHMFGATIGTLRVYLKTVNQTWTLNPDSAIFSKSGNQGDKWYRSFHHLGIIKEEFQIIIEGVRGISYISDIAIDDVKLIPNCTDEDGTTTTIDSSTYNELVPTVDSCEARCGQTEPISNDNYHLTCDCDENCFNNNRCCPDYFDKCGLGTTIPDEFDTAKSNEEENTDTTTNVEMAPVTSPITNKKSIDPTVPTRKPTTSIITPNNTTKIEVHPMQPSKPTTVRLSETSTERVFLVTTKNTPKMTPKYTRPVIHLQTPPPTTVIYRKILTTTTNKPLTSTKSDKQFDDAIDVPRPTSIDEGIYDVAEGAKEFWSNEIENSLDSPFLRNVSESNKLFSQTYVEEANSHFLILGVSLTCVVVLISVVVFVIIRRYRYGFSRSRGMMSSNGESQSDVTYLTSSDTLDLSLPDFYGQSN